MVTCFSGGGLDLLRWRESTESAIILELPWLLGMRGTKFLVFARWWWWGRLWSLRHYSGWRELHTIPLNGGKKKHVKLAWRIQGMAKCVSGWAWVKDGQLCWTRGSQLVFLASRIHYLLLFIVTDRSITLLGWGLDQMYESAKLRNTPKLKFSR